MAAVNSTGNAGTFEKLKTEKRFDRFRSFTEKIVAIQNSGVVPAAVADSTSTGSRLAFRVAKKARCLNQQYFLSGFEKLQLTESERSERRHALAQKLIAETLRQSDRSCRRRRRRRLVRVIRKKTILAPFMACIRWLSEPLVRLARIASLAKVEQSSKKSARVSSVPVDDDHSPLLLIERDLNAITLRVNLISR